MADCGGLVGLLVGFYHTPLVSVPMLLALFLGIMGMTDLLTPLVTHSLALGNGWQQNINSMNYSILRYNLTII
ncbi:MAG: hypothetical protein U1E98_05125 [Moraxella osloensis]